MMNKYGNFNSPQKQGFWKKESLGQNFLVNPHILDKIVSSAEITANDIIIEVGPGFGNLTQKLAEKSRRVIAIEKDRRLIPILENTLKKYNNIEIIGEDILKLNYNIFFSRFNTDYKVVANIPYYITSNFLCKLLNSRSLASGKLKLIVLTIQKEVAQRIMSKPPHMNLLALSVQYYSEPKIIGYISKNNFRPIPKIDSAIIKLVPRNNEHKNNEQTEKLFKIIKIGFSEKRKQLASNLSKKLKIPKEKVGHILTNLGLNPRIRSENLSLEQWILLKKELDI